LINQVAVAAINVASLTGVSRVDGGEVSKGETGGGSIKIRSHLGGVHGELHVWCAGVGGSLADVHVSSRSKVALNAVGSSGVTANTISVRPIADTALVHCAVVSIAVQTEPSRAAHASALLTVAKPMRAGNVRGTNVNGSQSSTDAANILSAVVRGDQLDRGVHVHGGCSGVPLCVEKPPSVGPVDPQSNLIGQGIEVDGLGLSAVLPAEIHDEESVDKHEHIIISGEGERLSTLICEGGGCLHGKSEIT
jgi:hypothetical protein